MYRIGSYIFVFFLSFIVDYSPVLSQDCLPNSFHKEKRDRVRSALDENSLAIFFANPIRNRTNDVDYLYHFDPDMYYLTGLEEPNAVLLLFNDTLHLDGMAYTEELLFVQNKDPHAELWHGSRLGPQQVRESLDVKNVLGNHRLLSGEINWNEFDQILINKIPEGVAESDTDTNLYHLIESVIESLQNPIPKTDQAVQSAQDLIMDTPLELSDELSDNLKRTSAYYPSISRDSIIQSYIHADRLEIRQSIIAYLSSQRKSQSKKVDLRSLPRIMSSLREIKSQEELALLQRAIDISLIGHAEVMRALHPDMSEREIEYIHRYCYVRFGSSCLGYPAIVGSGDNACVLHYNENKKKRVGETLVLMDVGAEYCGYSADITRTIPATGRFTKEQKDIYNIVLDAQKAAIDGAIVGASFRATNSIANSIINKGLADLGIIESIDQSHNYFPHGTSHYLGLDVHDAGNYGALEEGMVITVEPGIYIPYGSPCDEKWWGIGVRIEDDILIHREGPINLSAKLPRSVDEIEALMSEHSVFEHLDLQPMK